MALRVVTALVVVRVILDVLNQLRIVANLVGGLGGEAYSTPAVTLGTTLTLSWVGLVVFLAVRTLQGRNWARIVLTTLLGFALVYSVLMGRLSILGGDPLEQLVHLPAAVVTVALLPLLWLPAANRWVRATELRRVRTASPTSGP